MATPASRPSCCPRCGAAVSPADRDCGRCGIVLAKYDPRRPGRPLALVPPAPRPDGDATEATAVDHDPSWRAVVVAKALLWVALVVWTLAFARHSVASNYAGESVLHPVNLVFHEAGHIVFALFGHFVAAAGGSVMQGLVPLVCSVALLRGRDRFGAAVGLWWAGQNLVDLAPYVDDARALRLVLLGGRTGAEVEGHDWEYLLSALGWLHRDHALAQAAHLLGLAVMALALVAGAVVLTRQWRDRGRDGRNP